MPKNDKILLDESFRCLGLLYVQHSLLERQLSEQKAFIERLQEKNEWNSQFIDELSEELEAFKMLKKYNQN